MPEGSSPSLFPATRWTLLQRVRVGSKAEAQAALEALCRAYWQPLYCVARQRLHSTHDAQDAVQGFFENMLRLELFSEADESAGKLRQLLLTAFSHYCGQQWQAARAQKRGGGAVHMEFNEFFSSDQAEQRYLKSHTGSASVEALYTREWANAVLERSLDALHADYKKRGWLARYELLVGPLLQKDDAASLEHIAAGEGVTAGSLRITLHRMRGHYRDQIERELATTLDTDDPKVIRAELMELFKAFG